MNWEERIHLKSLSDAPTPLKDIKDLFTAIKVLTGGYLCVGILCACLWSTFHKDIKREELFQPISVVVLRIVYSVWTP